MRRSEAIAARRSAVVEVGPHSRTFRPRNICYSVINSYICKSTHPPRPCGRANKTETMMEQELTVALIYDFDGTLAPGNMQEYDFIPAVGKSNKEFWSEANALAEAQDADPVLTYPHDSGGAEQGALAAARGVSGVGPQHRLLPRRGGLVSAHERLCRREGFASAALRQLVGTQGDNRGHLHRPRIQARLRLLVSLQRRRHSLLARRGGQLHQQDAIPAW